jgi:ubiquinone/menaquinone biosynthesis C-methylase UbiE
VPPNVKFEIDDATLPWTWADGTFDFIHIRYLTGSIPDWTALFAQAFRTCKPGGWVESCECDVEFLSDDGTSNNVPALETWNELFEEGGKRCGRSFTLVRDNTQWQGIEAAGFVNMQLKNVKVCI